MPVAAEGGGGLAPAPTRSKKTRARPVASSDDIVVSGHGSGGIDLTEDDLFPPMSVNEIVALGYDMQAGVPGVHKVSKMFNPEAVLNAERVEDLPPATYNSWGKPKYVPYPPLPDETPGANGGREARPWTLIRDMDLRKTRGGSRIRPRITPLPGVGRFDVRGSTSAGVPDVEEAPPEYAPPRLEPSYGGRYSQLQDELFGPRPGVSGSASGGVEADLLARAARPKFNPLTTEVENARAAYSAARQQDADFTASDVPFVDAAGRWATGLLSGWARAPVDQTPESDLPDRARDLHKALRAQRSRALDSSNEGKPIRKQVDRLTQEEWDALDPQQKAAVEFNAEVVNAVRRDRRLGNSYTADKEQKETYRDKVDEIFGEGHGSKTYAPETVAFLDQIGYRDPNADLDDFLNLRATVHAQDLDNLTTQATPSAVMGRSVSPMSNRQIERIGVAQDVTAGFRDFKQRINEDRMKLDTLGASLAAERSDAVGFLGGTPRTPGPEHGLTEGVDAFFDEAVAILNDPKADQEKTWGYISTKLSPKQMQQFEAFFDKHKVEPKKKEGDSGTS